MKKLLSLVAISTMAVVSSAHAIDGTIQFKGQIVDTPCVVNSSTQNFEVNMGQVKKSDLDGAAGRQAPNGTAFQIKLEDCDTTTYNQALITFSGIGVAGQPGILQTTLGAGSASGVGIKLYDHNSVHIPLNTASNGVALVNGSNTLNFSAYYISTDAAVTTGYGNATADFTFTYQ
jgi:type 1 fimbria pilin